MIEKVKSALSIVFEIFIWTITFAVTGVAFLFMGLFRHYGILCLVAAIVLVGGDKIINMLIESSKKEKENKEKRMNRRNRDECNFVFYKLSDV